MTDMQALAVMGGEKRREQAALKRRVAAGETSLLDALRDPLTARLPVADVIQWQTRWGVSRMRGALEIVGLSESVPCAGLSARRAEELAEVCSRSR
jgi:hypothetical protein